MGVERTESDSPKTKARSSLYDGDERKRSWSCRVRILLVGQRKWNVVGGGGRSGVSGGGSEGVGGCRRARGIKGGSFCNELSVVILENESRLPETCLVHTLCPACP